MSGVIFTLVNKTCTYVNKSVCLIHRGCLRITGNESNHCITTTGRSLCCEEVTKKKKKEKRLHEIVSNHCRPATKQENGGYTSQILLKHFQTGCLPLS